MVTGTRATGATASGTIRGTQDTQETQDTQDTQDTQEILTIGGSMNTPMRIMTGTLRSSWR